MLNPNQIDLSDFSDEEKEALLNRIEQNLIERARKDVNTFIEYVMRDEDGSMISQGELHKEWQVLFEDNEKIVIVAPRDHGKTTQVIGYCLYRIGLDPNIRIKIVCQSDKNAKNRLQQIKQYIEESVEYHNVFPHVRKCPVTRDWTKHSLTVERSSRSKDATLEAWGIESSATGGRADLILFDDVVDESNAIKHPSKRDSIKVKFYNVWLNMLGPDDEMIYIGTRWHQDDLTGELLDKEGYKSKIYAIDEEFNPIWVEKWSKSALKKRRVEIGARAFDLGYRNEPLSLEERTFSVEALDQVKSKFDAEKLMVEYPGRNTFMGVDLAQSTHGKGSRTVIFVVKVIDKIRYVMDIRAGRWETGDIVNEIVHLNQFYKPVLIYVENNSFQTSVIQWIEALSDENSYNIPVQGAFTSSNKFDMQMGLPALASEMKRGLWKANYSDKVHQDKCDARHKCDYCIWFEELRNFPIGSSTDFVMANWLCMQAIWNGPQPNDTYERKADIINELLRRDEMEGGPMMKGVLDMSVFH